MHLSHAVARAEAGTIKAGRRVLESLTSVLAAYQPFHAAHAELLSHSGQDSAALAAYDRAIDLASNPSDAISLRQRRAQTVEIA